MTATGVGLRPTWFCGGYSSKQRPTKEAFVASWVGLGHKDCCDGFTYGFSRCE